MPSRVKLVVVGDASVGKTSLLTRYTKDVFLEGYEPTVFDNYEAVHMVDGQSVTLALCDTAGEEAYADLRKNSYASGDIFLLCFSVDNLASLENIKTTWAPEVKSVMKEKTRILLVGLKSDLREDLDSHNLVSSSKAKEVRKQIGAKDLMECSSKKKINLDKVFEQAIKIALSDFSIQKPDSKICKFL